jgi:hypothetical protein
MVFWKRHKHFPANECLDNMIAPRDSVIKSDVIIMKVGTKARYTSLGGVSRVMADWVAKR